MYPTLSSIAEGLLSAFIRSADDVQELNARETAILQALDSLYDRRFRELKTQMSELRTHEDLKMKTAMTAGTVHDGKRKNP